MIPHRPLLIWLAFAAWGSASPASSSAQIVSVESAQRRITQIDQELADLDDVARKIRGENYRVVLGGTVGDPQFILVSPEQVESLFVSALLNGSMRTDQAARLARGFGQATREFLASVEAEMQQLRESRARIAEALRRGDQTIPISPTTPVTGAFAGSVTGRWSAGCSWNSDDPGARPSTDGGTFTLAFDGRGGASGSYQGSNGAYGISGGVTADGSANGSGSGDGWSVNWSGRFQQTGGGITGGGGLTVAISSLGGGSCTGTWAVP
jgi:hypothetical protein